MQITKYFIINIEDLFLIQFILEGYERLVTITTLNKEQGLIKINFGADSKIDVKNIVEALRKEFHLEIDQMTYGVQSC